MITHIFFDLHGTIIDSQRLGEHFRAGIGRIMAARYGLTPQAWSDANGKIQADWDSYYADLNLGGENGMADLREGMFRTTRALFRLVRMNEPDKAEISALAVELAENAPAGDSLYPDVLPVLQALHERGYQLGVCSHALSQQARTTLSASGALSLFNAPIVGPDVVAQFEKDREYYWKVAALVGIQPQNCLIVDDHSRAVTAAKSAGMQAAHMLRTPKIPAQSADYILYDTLDALLNLKL